MKGLAFASASLLLFGVWGFVAKVATDEAGSKFVFIFAQLPYIVIASVMLVLTGPYAVKWSSLRWTLLGGLFGAVGVLCFFFAIDHLPASRVVPMTAAYPAITILLSWLILHEKLTARHVVGVLFALVGVALLA